MSNLILPRRRFLTGLATLFAAPAIVRAASLMPVKAAEPEGYTVVFRTSLPIGSWRKMWHEQWAELAAEFMPINYRWVIPVDPARAILLPEVSSEPCVGPWRRISRVANPLEHRA